jgi:single-strand DNA-binding protein
LEGNLVKPSTFTETEKGVKVSTFSIAAIRFFKVDGKVEEEKSVFDVEAYGRLAKSLSVHGDEGRCVRVVGRLKQKVSPDSEGRQWSKVIIEAEHIEFRPLVKEAK